MTETSGPPPAESGEPPVVATPEATAPTPEKTAKKAKKAKAVGGTAVAATEGGLFGGNKAAPEKHEKNGKTAEVEEAKEAKAAPLASETSQATDSQEPTPSVETKTGIQLDTPTVQHPAEARQPREERLVTKTPEAPDANERVDAHDDDHVKEIKTEAIDEKEPVPDAKTAEPSVETEPTSAVESISVETIPDTPDAKPVSKPERHLKVVPASSPESNNDIDEPVITLGPKELAVIRDAEIREEKARQAEADTLLTKKGKRRSTKKTSEKSAKKTEVPVARPSVDKEAAAILPPIAPEQQTPERKLKLVPDLKETEPETRKESGLTVEEEQERRRWAEEARFLASVTETAERDRIRGFEPDELNKHIDKWSRENPRTESSDVSNADYEAYIFSLNEAGMDRFTKLSSEEQDAAIKEHAERSRKPEPEKKPLEEAVAETIGPVVREVLPTNHSAEDMKNFANMLTDAEYLHFKSRSMEVRDRMIEEWKAKHTKDMLLVSKYIMESIPKELREKFNNELPDRQLELLQIWRDGGVPRGYEYKAERYGSEKGLQAPSYRIFDLYTDEDGERFEIITEHNLRTRALSKEERKQLIRWRDRFAANVLGKWYNLKVLMFNYEAFLAEENKHNQEMIRGIVDTGPDENERLVFAQKHGSVYLDYNGNEVSAEIVRKQQKKALHHPARFQALCHYELSKREEPEQAKLWEEIFEMMAHHHYDRYAMFGVVVGLQFMNKPSYLAYKNASIEWMPEYVEAVDEHGHPIHDKQGNPVPEIDDYGNPKKQTYTAETIYEYRHGRRVLKRDADGVPVKIGDIIRSTQRARFATIDLILDENDQEYSEKLPDGTDKYAFKIRRIRDGKGEVAYTEQFKSKKILKLKRVLFAHEIAGKFMSYQYGFRSADVAVTLDEARHAMQTALSLSRKNDFTSVASQEAFYLLSRLKILVDTTRLGGGTSADGKEAAGGDEARIQSAQAEIALREEMIAEEMVKGTERAVAERMVARKFASGNVSGYPPRISGTAEANALFLKLADVVDRAATIFPHITQMRLSDYEAIQNEFYAKHAA